MTLMMMHLNDPLPDLRQLRPDVPPALAAVIERSLAKSREERFASMAEFAAALRAVLASLGSLTPAATVADSPERQAALAAAGAVATAADRPGGRTRRDSRRAVSASPNRLSRPSRSDPPQPSPLQSASPAGDTPAGATGGHTGGHTGG